jgi:trigger factor
MQVSVENTNGLERRLTVQVPGQEIQVKVDSKLRELSKTVRVKGFRPGRVPMSVVKQRYGKQVRLDILNETMQEGLQQAIRDEDLRPASRPRLDAEPEDKEGGDFEFSALLEVYPEIGKLDAGAMTIERPLAEISDEDVEEMLATLRSQRKTWVVVERTAQAGDRVLLEYSAETKEGRVPPEGEQRFNIVMGESGFEELEKSLAPIPGGERKSVKLTFPENFREASLAGKKAKVDLHVVSVSEGTLPEVDEAFIQSFGVEDGKLESFRDEIRNNLKRELKQATSTLLKMRLIEELKKISPDLEVPASLVRQEAASMVAQMAQGQEIPPEQMQALIEPFREQAEGRVRAGLLLGELAQQNHIHTNAAKVREAIEIVASTYEEPADVVRLYYGNQNLLQQVESSVLEEQVVDWVLENATVNTQEMKFQDVITAATTRS